MKFAFLGIAAAAAMYTNCQPAPRGQLQDYGSQLRIKPTASPARLAAAQPPFEAGKVQLDLAVANSAGSQKISTQSLPPGTRLHFILNNACLASGHGQELAQAAAASTTRLENLQRQSYRLTLERSLDISALTELAEKDPCVFGLAMDAKASVTELTSFNPTDPKFSAQKNMQSIRIGPANRLFQGGYRGANADVIVAVVDSGVDYNHEDLTAQMLRRNDGSLIGGEQFDPNKTSPDGDPMDDLGHGTRVAGLIGATLNNGVGVAGVFGTAKLKLLPLKVTDEAGSSFLTDVAWGIDQARSKGADVINISISGNTAIRNAAIEQAIQDAIAAGVVVVFAAGNNGAEVSEANPYTPCFYGLSNNGALCVGAIDSTSFDRSSFSNWSSQYIEISAPGSGGVYSTTKGNSYGDESGTSFSSPQVAGAAALIVSFFKTNNISYTPAIVESVLKQSAIRSAGLANVIQDGQILDLKNLSDFLQQIYLTPLAGGISDDL